MIIDAGADVLNRIKTFAPGLTAEHALSLELRVEESVELPLVFAMAVAWGTIWNRRRLDLRTILLEQSWRLKSPSSENAGNTPRMLQS